MNAPMQCLQNALAYFDTPVSYDHKMFMDLSPGVNYHNLFILGQGRLGQIS
jgi:hypothetical protein